MQILFGVQETVIKINSKSISIEYIQHFISTHFKDRTIKDNYILIPASNTNIFHRTFLLKWIYSLYAKKTKNKLPELRTSLLKRQHKRIKIILPKKIIHTLLYKVIDGNTIHIKITPSNVIIAQRLKIFLQANITILPSSLQVTVDTKILKKLLQTFMKSTHIIDVPHKHLYNTEEIEKFFNIKSTIKKKKFSPLENAYTILGLTPNDDIKIIKKRYKTLAKTFHPDKVSMQEQNRVNLYTEKFQHLLSAYEIITKHRVQS